MRLAQIWRYPVKSMQGERLAEAAIDGGGLVGDRRFGLCESSTGRALTGRRLPALLMASARLLEGGEAEITLPTGVRVSSSEPDIDRRLSDWLGLPVEFVRADTNRSFEYELPVPEEVVLVYGTGRPVQLVLGCRSGLKDVAPIHILSTADLDGESIRRFRPNLLLESENREISAPSTLTFDQVELEVSDPTIRCVMVTRAQPGLDAAPGLLRELVTRSRARVGVYATVRRRGLVREGATN